MPTFKKLSFWWSVLMCAALNALAFNVIVRAWGTWAGIAYIPVLLATSFLTGFLYASEDMANIAASAGFSA